MARQILEPAVLERLQLLGPDAKGACGIREVLAAPETREPQRLAYAASFFLHVAQVRNPALAASRFLRRTHAA
jgi:hypothetical protein